MSPGDQWNKTTQEWCVSTDLTFLVMGGGKAAENIAGCREPPAHGPQHRHLRPLPRLVQQLPHWSPLWFCPFKGITASLVTNEYNSVKQNGIPLKLKNTKTSWEFSLQSQLNLVSVGQANSCHLIRLCPSFPMSSLSLRPCHHTPLFLTLSDMPTSFLPWSFLYLVL